MAAQLLHGSPTWRAPAQAFAVEPATLSATLDSIRCSSSTAELLHVTTIRKSAGDKVLLPAWRWLILWWAHPCPLGRALMQAWDRSHYSCYCKAIPALVCLVRSRVCTRLRWQNGWRGLPKLPCEPLTRAALDLWCHHDSPTLQFLVTDGDSGETGGGCAVAARRAAGAVGPGNLHVQSR